MVSYNGRKYSTPRCANCSATRFSCLAAVYPAYQRTSLCTVSSAGVILCSGSVLNGVIVLRIQLRPVSSRSISFQSLENVLLTSKNVKPAPVPRLHFACRSRQTFHCARASPAPRTTILPETASENRCLLLPRTRPFPTAPRVPAFVRTRRSVSHSEREESLPVSPLCSMAIDHSSTRRLRRG